DDRLLSLGVSQVPQADFSRIRSGVDRRLPLGPSFLRSAALTRSHSSRGRSCPCLPMDPHHVPLLEGPCALPRTYLSTKPAPTWVAPCRTPRRLTRGLRCLVAGATSRRAWPPQPSAICNGRRCCS